MEPAGDNQVISALATPFVSEDPASDLAQDSFDEDGFVVPAAASTIVFWAQGLAGPLGSLETPERFENADGRDIDMAVIIPLHEGLLSWDAPHYHDEWS